MTAQLAPTPIQKFFDNNGNPLFNGKLYSYVAGTSTPQATYTDSTMGTQNTNPVILNARGEANVWLDTTLSYKLVLQEANGTQIWAVDNIPGNGVFGTVQNIAALRNVTGVGVSNYQAIIVDGYTTAGDGGGGTFWWNSISTVADNGGTIIAPTGVSTGRWYRLFSNSLSALQFGADNTGASDSTSSLNNLFSACGTNLRIILNGGTYKVTSLPSLTTPQHIECDSPVTIVHSGSGVLWTINGATINDQGPIISGSSLTLTPGVGTTELMVYESTFHGNIENLVCDGTNNNNVIGIEIRSGVSSGGCYYNTFNNCMSTNCGTNWKLKTYVSGNIPYINDNVFINCKGRHGVFIGNKWSSSFVTPLGALIIPTNTSDNFIGQLFQATVSGTTGLSEPAWSMATELGNTISDNGVTWTRVGWDTVTQTGIGWLMVNAQGNTWVGGDAEDNDGFGMAFILGSSTYSNVNGLWLEANGSLLPAGHSGGNIFCLLDNVTSSSSGTAITNFTFSPAACSGQILGVGWLGTGCQVQSPYDQRTFYGQNILAYGSAASGAWDEQYDVVTTRVAAGIWGVPAGYTMATGGVNQSLSVSSGTLYQNIYNAALTIYLPVTFTPTSGSSATCAIALGSSSSPPTIATETVPAGTALDSFIRLLTIRVPQGWYFSFTTINATIGSPTGLLGA